MENGKLAVGNQQSAISYQRSVSEFCVLAFLVLSSKKETPFDDVSDCFMWTMSVVRSLLTVVLFSEANSSRLSDDSDLDLTWVSHFSLDLFREVE